jgi:hypothetical protein
MAYDPFRSAPLASSRRPRKVDRSSQLPAAFAPEARVTLSEALAHELNNPLCVALMEVAALRDEGHDVQALDYALQRIQAVGAELRLPQRLQSVAANRLELNQAFGIVLELLGRYASRVDLKLPTVRIQLEPLPLCQFLHSMLLEHLEADASNRVLVSGQYQDGHVTVVVSSGARSARVRADLLELARPDSESRPDESQVSAMRLAQSLRLPFAVDDSATLAQTRFELPVRAALSAVQPHSQAS